LVLATPNGAFFVAMSEDVRSPCVPSAPSPPATLDGLARALARLDGSGARTGTSAVATLGAEAVDSVLPGGGLKLAAVHEVAGSAASGFVAALAGRVAQARPGLVVWCQHRRRVRDEGGLHGPGLAAFGLDPARVLLVDGEHDDAVLWATEEALRASATAVVVGEVERVDLFRTRRLQLAAESGGAAGLLLRPVEPVLEPSAAVTRWRVRPYPLSSPWPGELGPLAWSARLWRAKGAVPARFEMSFDEPTLRFALVADLADRPLPARSAAPG
jgi:protein ImuA